jgi:putative membrane protein insertion efficiency factor
MHRASDRRSDPVIRACMLALVRFYRRFFSPLLPAACRFEPTCSQYALDAIEMYGALKGGWLTLRRLLRCQPFSRGGFDPVPVPKTCPAEHDDVSRTNCHG